MTSAIRTGWGFYILFAFAITSSVQLAGVYVVFTSLILPALAVVKLRRKLPAAWTVGVLSVLLGVLLAAFRDLPTGPVIVLAYFTTVLVARLLLRHLVKVG